MADATITRYDLAFGSKDTVTGTYAKTYTASSIEGSIQPRGAVLFIPGFGASTAKYPQTLYTADVIHAGDEVKDAAGSYYRVEAADKYSHLNQFSHYQCNLTQRSPAALRPDDSGTWHLDSDSARTDPRYRTKAWLDTYMSAANMKLDDGATAADVDVCFSGFDYPLHEVFIEEDVDGLMIVDKRAGDQLSTYNHYPYAFIETVPVTCCAVDKSGLTATNLLEQMEQEIRHVCTDHPIGSIREVSRTEYKHTDIGAATLWETTVTIRYKRANDDFSTTYPRITYGASGSPDGTYYFPNVTRIEWPNGSPDIRLLPPGRVGNVHQIMGGSSLRVRLYCDLDVGNSTYAWKRAQTGVATDVREEQVFWEMLHQASIIAGDEPYQTLTFSASGPSFKVRLESMDVVESGGGRTLMLEFEEYVSADASGSSYSTRWGFS